MIKLEITAESVEGLKAELIQLLGGLPGVSLTSGNNSTSGISLPSANIHPDFRPSAKASPTSSVESVLSELPPLSLPTPEPPVPYNRDAAIGRFNPFVVEFAGPGPLPAQVGYWDPVPEVGNDPTEGLNIGSHRLEAMRNIGTGRYVRDILLYLYDLESLQKGVILALDWDIRNPEHQEKANSLAGHMVQLSHVAFPELAGTYDHSTKWRREADRPETA